MTYHPRKLPLWGDTPGSFLRQSGAPAARRLQWLSEEAPRTGSAAVRELTCIPAVSPGIRLHGFCYALNSNKTTA